MSSPRTFGFRFSVVDGCAIALCVVGVLWLGELLRSFVGILPCALGHFFLFCNVFRVRRSFELVWTAVLLLNFAIWLGVGFSWLGLLGTQTPFTLLAIAAELRSPRYHGIGARRLNPDLEAYLAGE